MADIPQPDKLLSKVTLPPLRYRRNPLPPPSVVDPNVTRSCQPLTGLRSTQSAMLRGAEGADIPSRSMYFPDPRVAEFPKCCPEI